MSIVQKSYQFGVVVQESKKVHDQLPPLWKSIPIYVGVTWNWNRCWNYISTSH